MCAESAHDRSKPLLVKCAPRVTRSLNKCEAARTASIDEPGVSARLQVCRSCVPRENASPSFRIRELTSLLATDGSFLRVLSDPRGAKI